jgi:hypothetical protein
MSRWKLTKEVVEAYQRSFSLRDKGSTWAEVEKVLKTEGYRDSKGNFFKASSLRSQYSRRRDKIMKMAPGQFLSASPLPARAIQKDPTFPEKSEPSLPGYEEIRRMIREELHSILETTELRVQRPGRGGRGDTATVKKSFSLPRDLWEEVEKLGGIASNHVAMALQLYLRMKEAGKGLSRD